MSEPNLPATVSLPRFDPSMTVNAEGALQLVRDFDVADDEMRGYALNELKTIKSSYKSLDEKEREFTVPLNGLLKQVRDLFRPAKTYYEEAERILKGKVLAFDQEQERIRVEQERKAREAEAAERRRIEDAARADAERARKEAETRAAQLEQEGLAHAAQQARLNAEHTAAEIQREAAAEAQTVAVAVTAPAVTKAKGEATRAVWKGECQDLDALIKAAAEGNQIARSCLTFNQTAINQQAKATKGSAVVPGLRFWPDRSLAVRA